MSAVEMSEPTPCERDGHDYEFLGRREYGGQRPGYWVDEFYCRKCLATRMRREERNVADWYGERSR